ncbi:MAG: TonB-dependent receptor [Saprospiraceae bacterium]|nr:TonB-dependent receptor [Saprospiraceae bacterium]
MRIQVHIIIAIFSLVEIMTGFAQGISMSDQGIVYGLITDSETGEPLALAHVRLDPLSSGSVSDEEGRYELSRVPEGVYTLQISSLGYHGIVRDSIQISSGDRLEFNFALELASIKTNEVVITAARRAQAMSLAPASVATVNAEEIKSQNLQTFDQAFDGLTGVQVTRSSGANVQALSIRGASEVAGGGIGNRVLLLIDGRPSLSPESGGALWTLVPLNSIDRIEVVKGAYSSLFGSSAMGGVINVITKSPVQKSSTSGHFNFGTYGRAPSNAEYDDIGQYYTAELSHSGTAGNWKYVVDAGRKSNQGHRQKSAFDINNFFGKLVYQPNFRDKITFTGNFNQIKNDAPATWLNSRLAYTVAAHRLDDFQNKREYSTDINYQSLRNGNLKYNGRLYYYRNNSIFTFNDDPENKSETNVNFGIQSVDKSTVLTDRIGTAFQLDYHVPKHYLIAGFDVKSDYVNGQPDTVLYGMHRSISAGIYVQDEIPLGKKIISTLGLRYDYFYLNSAFNESNFSPKLAAVYQHSDQLSFRFLFAKAFRNPSMAERFIKFEQGGGLRFEPNGELRAEKLVASVELGSIYRIGKFMTLDLALFHNRYKDLISFRQLPTPSGGLLYKVINLNEAIMQGMEVNLRYRSAGSFSGSLGYTFLDARDVSDGRFNDYLAYKVKHSVNATLGYRYKSLSTTFSGRYRSGIKEVFIYPGSEPDAYFLFNGKISYDFSENLSTYFSIDNFTNTQYEELERYRMPGKSYTVGLRFNF